MRAPLCIDLRFTTCGAGIPMEVRAALATEWRECAKAAFGYDRLCVNSANWSWMRVRPVAQVNTNSR